MAELKLLVLGPPRLERDGQRLPFPLRRAQALLAYLAMTGRPQSRESLAAMLWPEATQGESRSRLRRTLHRVTQALGEGLILTEGDSVQLASGASLWVDGVAFRQLAADALPPGGVPGHSDLAALAEAAALYTGDFLDGFFLRDSVAWDEWQFQQRDELQRTCGRLLERLVSAYHADHAWEEAVGAARQWVELDRWHEPAHRALIASYGLAGRRAAAMRQYEECRRLLAELGSEPEAETTDLYRAIQARHITAPPVQPEAPPTHTLSRPGVSFADSSAETETSKPPFVGRDDEIGLLHGYLDLARGGARRVVLVTGEAGAGKTALVETFLEQALRGGQAQLGADCRIARGQCLEYRGGGEAYLPVLEAIGRLCQEPGGRSLVEVLTQRAPTWLLQMPWLVDASELPALRQRVIGATRDRMLREMVESLDVLAAERPLIMLLEDLHWSDLSTLDLLAAVAQRRAPARLMLIGTYREGEAQARQHPIDASARELHLRGLCQVLPAAALTDEAVTAYVAERCPGLRHSTEVARLIHERTEGNPLFMVNLVDSWVARGWLTEQSDGALEEDGLLHLVEDIPDNVRELVELQLSRLDASDLEALEAASVVGMRFAPDTVAAALDRGGEELELRCRALTRQGQFLDDRGSIEWPDGTASSSIGFTHSLYRRILYEQIPVGRRVRLHQRIGEWLERAYGAEAHARGGELAFHFTRGRDRDRSVRYLYAAAQQALQRSAHREAMDHLRAGLDLLDAWPDSSERSRHELLFQAALAPILVVAQGWGSDEAEQRYLRARTLSEQLGTRPQRFQLLFGLAAMHEWRADYAQSRALMEERLRLGDASQPDELLEESYDLLACSLFHQGAFDQALSRAEQGLSIYEPHRQHSLVAPFGVDPGVQNHGWAAFSLWFLGRADEALDRARAALEIAESHPYSLALAHGQLARVHQLRREHARARESSETALALATERGFPYTVASSTMLRGWALSGEGRHAEGIASLLEGLAACRASGAMLDYPYFLALLAEAHGAGGRLEEGLAALSEALELVNHSRSFFYEAELHRLRGALLLQASAPAAADDAERSFLTALDVARRQGARSLELRVCVDLGELWRSQGKTVQARRLIEGVSRSVASS